MGKKLVIVLFLLLVITQVFAQDQKSPFIEVIKETKNSVVFIKVDVGDDITSVSQEDVLRYFFYGIPPDKDLSTTIAMGSGFVFETKGQTKYIMTNYHVVRDLQGYNDYRITVTLADKQQYKAEIMGIDPYIDLAVLKIESKDKVKGLNLGNSDNVQIGEWAIAIGNPFGDVGLERTVTIGVVSATERSNLNFGENSPLYQDYIQTDAAINPGNSGGPLINIDGEVIGINSAISSVNGGNIGLGFAIPVNLAKKSAYDILNFGKVKRAKLGVYLKNIDETLKKTLRLPTMNGVYIEQIAVGSAAERAGIKKGDVILEVDKKVIKNLEKFKIMVATADVNEKFKITLFRDGKQIKISAILQEME